MPFLPHKEKYYAPERGLSALSAALTLISTLVGAGLLSLPYAAYQMNYTLSGLMAILLLI